MKSRRENVRGWAWASVAGLLAAAPLAGHDMRLEPSSFTPPAGAPVALGLLVGDAPAQAEPVARDSGRIVRFIAAGPGGETPVAGVDGVVPAGVFRPDRPGSWVIAYQSTPAFLELPVDRFEHYLAEEGLERVRALRRARGEAEAPGRERYSRNLKTLLAVAGPPASDGGEGGMAAPAGGDGGRARAPEGSGADRAVGLPLELVALADPYRLTPGEALPVRVLFAGEGVEGVRVEALRLDGAGEVLAATSDTAGRVVFRLPSAGAWMLAAVHMVEAAAPAPGCAGAACAEADWESFWASLTFALGRR